MQSLNEMDDASHAKKVAELISLSKEEFENEYKEYDESRRKEIYCLVLHEIYEAVLSNKVKYLQELGHLIELINGLEGREKLKCYFDIKENHFWGTNAIILACKYGKDEIIKYLFSNEAKVMKNISEYTGLESVNPSSIDRECHNCFYYAIRSNSIRLLNALINEWPDNYFVRGSEDLDHIISKAYKELMLKNIFLSEEMKYCVENKLIDLRFYSDETHKAADPQNNVKNTTDRIHLVLKYIKTLTDEYSTNKKVDARFLIVVKFIASNIHILKQKLTSTKNRIPWEEMEYCLVSFVSSRTTKKEISLYFYSILKTEKLLRHLQCFAECLKIETEENDDVKETKKTVKSQCKKGKAERKKGKKEMKDEKEVEKQVNLQSKEEKGNVPTAVAENPSKQGKLQRNEVIAQIKSKYPLFVELYDDYQHVKDIHSLEKMRYYINLALSADCRIGEGQLVILRALQVIGEHVKNTTESPKLSYVTSKLLLDTVSGVTRDIIKDLRDSLSHPIPLSEKAELDEELYKNIQNDIKNTGAEIFMVLLKIKMNIIKSVLEEFVISDGSETVNEMVEIFYYTDFNEIGLNEFKQARFDFVKDLMKKFIDLIVEKTSIEKDIFEVIEEIINHEKRKTDFTIKQCETGFNTIKGLSGNLSDRDLDNRRVNQIKAGANYILQRIPPIVESDRDYLICCLLTKLVETASPRMTSRNQLEIINLYFKCIKTFWYKTENSKWIEMYGDKLCKNKSEVKKKKNCNADENKCNTLLQQKFLMLENILRSNNLNPESFENIPFIFRNKNLQAALEMLLLDILSILGSSTQLLAFNQFFLDDHFPLLIGRCLRNHLAHGNALMDVLSSDPTTTLISNALKFNSENVIEKNVKIGKLVKEDLSRLEDRFIQDLEVITNQERMFSALEEGNYEELITCMEKGADILARSLNMWTTLHFAAKGQNLKIFKFVLGHNLDVNAKDNNGQSPLHIAATFGGKYIAEFIIEEKKIDINESDIFGKRPIDVAAQNGHKDVVELLLKHTPENSNLHAEIHGYALFHAVNNNQFDAAVLLIEHAEKVYGTFCGVNNSLLLEAAEVGCIELVNYLLERNANPNARDDKEKTPLHFAALNGHLEVVKTLILHGADVNTKCFIGSTPLHNAVECGHEEIVEILLKKGANVAEVIDCLTSMNSLDHHRGLYDTAALFGSGLLHENIVPFKDNTETVGGITPLHVAAWSGHKGIVELLLEYKANINAKDSLGKTPLHASSFYKHKDVVSLLLENGAQINDIDKSQRNSLHDASESGCKEVVEILISKGADINAEDINGHTPLHIAAVNGHKDVLEVVVKKEALIVSKDEDPIDFIGKKDKKGSTALHLAARKKDNKEVVEYLLLKGAKVNAKDSVDNTPLHIATMFDNTEVIKLLCEKEADVNLENKEKWTPLHYAVQRNHIDNVEYFTSIIGVNLNCGIDRGSTPLSLAVTQTFEEIVRILITKKADVNAGDSLLKTVEQGNKRISGMLLKDKNIAVNTGEEIVMLLRRAVIRDRGNILEALLKYFKTLKHIDVPEIEIQNLIKFTVHQGKAEVTEILLKYLETVNLDFDWKECLINAIIEGQNAVVEVLLHYGPDEKNADTYIKNAIQLAVIFNRLKCLETLLNHRKTDIHFKHEEGRNLLHIAAFFGHLEMVIWLFNKGVNSESTDYDGYKPIHLACMSGHVKVVEFFLNNGSDINECGAFGQTLLHYSVAGVYNNYTFKEIKSNVLQQNNGTLSVDDIDEIPSLKNTSKDYVNLLTHLLSKGIAYNATDDMKRKPLDMIKVDPSFDVYKFLVSIEKLFNAVKRNNLSEVKNCIKEGAFIDAKSADNSMVLHHAAWKGYENIVSILLKNKANANVIGKDGCMPMHYAAKFGHFGIVKALLLSGATYNVASNKGKTPLDFAEDEDIKRLLKLVDDAFKGVENHNSNVTEELKQVNDVEEVKAALNCCNRDKRSLVAHAIHSNFPAIVKLKQLLVEDLSEQIHTAQRMCHSEKIEESCKSYELISQKMNDRHDSDNPVTLENQFKKAKEQYKPNYFQGAVSNAKEIYKTQEILSSEKARDNLYRTINALLSEENADFSSIFNVDYSNLINNLMKLIQSPWMDNATCDCYV